MLFEWKRLEFYSFIIIVVISIYAPMEILKYENDGHFFPFEINIKIEAIYVSGM